MSNGELTAETHLLENKDTSVSTRVRTFYFVRLWSCEDSQLQGLIEENENLVREMGEQKTQISEKLSEIIAERERKLWNLNWRNNSEYWRFGNNERVDKMRELKFILDKVNFANNAYQGRARTSNIRFSGDEFDKHKFQFRMLHGTKNLAEEKRMLREIKPLRQGDGKSRVNLEQHEKNLPCENQHPWFYFNCKYCIEIAKEHKLTREICIASASVKGEMWNSFGSKLDLQNELKIVSSEVDELRRVNLEIRSEMKLQELQEFNIAKLEKDIEFLKQKLYVTNKTKYEAQERIIELRTQTCNKIEKFMSKWNDSKTFRDDYVKRMSSSFERRGLSMDGRLKNPDEEVVVSSNENVELVTLLRRKIKWKNHKDSNLINKAEIVDV